VGLCVKKVYEGKTKTVYDLEDGHYLLQFKDDVTGEGDVIDPGANTVIGKVEGKGNASLKMSKYFFELIQTAGIPTHYVSADLENSTMVVKKAECFGAGLEFVCRLQATGSFVRRYGKYVQEGQPLDYLVEITLKDDLRGDPLVNDETLVQLKLMTAEEIEEVKAATKRITGIIKEKCDELGLELVDIKLEFGRIDGKIALIDEISGDNMRVKEDNRILLQKKLCEKICG